MQYLIVAMPALLIAAAAVSLVRYHMKRKDGGIDWWAVLNSAALMAIPAVLILNLLNVIGRVPTVLIIVVVVIGTYEIFSRKRQ